MPAKRGPGQIVLVVGPSGAGKDTIIRAARERLADRLDFVFPQRTITRSPSEAEDNIWLDREAFEQHRQAGAFVAAWEAHGFSYALPRSVDSAVERGLTIVCNVSRTIVPAMGARYGNIHIVEITATAETLGRRLLQRAREAPASLDERLRRSDEIQPVEADSTIRNDGALAEAVEQFISILHTARKSCKGTISLIPKLA